MAIIKNVRYIYGVIWLSFDIRSVMNELWRYWEACRLRNRL